MHHFKKKPIILMLAVNNQQMEETKESEKGNFGSKALYKK